MGNPGTCETGAYKMPATLHGLFLKAGSLMCLEKCRHVFTFEVESKRSHLFA